MIQREIEEQELAEAMKLFDDVKTKKKGGKKAILEGVSINICCICFVV